MNSWDASIYFELDISRSKVLFTRYNNLPMHFFSWSSDNVITNEHGVNPNYDVFNYYLITTNCCKTYFDGNFINP